MTATINQQELKAKIDRKEPFVLVETLAEDHYRQGHLPGARNLPPTKVKELAPSVLPDKNADIVVYCGGYT